MRQLKLLGLVAMAILSLSIAVTSTAQALELRLLPENVKFSFKGGETKLETLSAKTIVCEKVKGTGEATSQRLGNAEFKFENCKSGGVIQCTGLADAAGNITVSTSFHIRHLLKGEPESPPEPEKYVILAILVPAAHFSCLGVLFVVKGCVASMDLLTKENGTNIVNELVAKIFVDFLQEKGEQKPLKIDTDNSLGMEECTLMSKEGNNGEETAGQLGKGEIEKCEPTGCTFLVDLSGTQ